MQVVAVQCSTLLQNCNAHRSTTTLTVYGGTVAAPPHGVGVSLTGAAVIDDPGSTKFKKGQRVVQVPFSSTPGQGTWQQYLAVPEKNLLAIPDSVGDEDAAQLWVSNPKSTI